MITSTPLALFYLLTALFSAGELSRSRGAAEVESYIADREAQATHVLMNGGMAMMFADFYSPVLGHGILIGYSVAIAVIAVRLFVLLTRRHAAVTNRIAGSLYHAVSLATMIYAISVMPMDAASMGTMGGMPMASNGSALLNALAAIFALDGIATVALVGLFPKLLIRMKRRIDGAGSVLRVHDTRTLRAIRLAAIPHCIMDLGMVLMVLA